MAFTYEPQVTKAAITTGYGGGDHWLVHADVPTWLATLEKAVAGDKNAITAWSAFRSAAPEVERLAWEFLELDYGETKAMLTKSARPNSPKPDPIAAGIARLPGGAIWAQKRGYA